MSIRRFDRTKYSRWRGESQIPGGSGTVPKRGLDAFELPIAWISGMQSVLGLLNPADV
jgi:hypothetical protein